MSIEDWTIQLKKGILEYCILLLIYENPCYGYEIMTKLSQWPIVSAKESTVYPLLRRLQKEGCLKSFWQNTTEGLPPRKYYSITTEGKNYLTLMSGEWKNLTTTLEKLQKQKP